ncbi:MAG: hypothetical protein GEV11_10515 [Streptosporangiales bacterium]|nr:hypothetical protein [Streptosporangiales bacterium]
MIRGESRLVAGVATAEERDDSRVPAEVEVLRHLRRVGFYGPLPADPLPHAPRAGPEKPAPEEKAAPEDALPEEALPEDALPEDAVSERALRAMARLLRRFHDAMASFPSSYGSPPYGLGGVTPHDVTFTAGLPRGLARPGRVVHASRMSDIAVTLLYWAPVRDPASRPPPQRPLDPGPRLAGFCDAYGLGALPRRAVLPLIRDHLAAGPRITTLAWLDAHWDELDVHLR